MIVEVYLAFTMIAGAVRDVDAFLSLDACLSDLARARSNLVVAKRARPDFTAIELVGCMPALVDVPTPPAEATK